MKINSDILLLYAVTDRSFLGTQTLLEQLESAIKGGVTCVQLREKEMKEEEFLKEAIKVKDLCKKYQIPLIINDNVNIAIACDADGVHLGQSDMGIAEARKLLGKDKIIGATAKTIEQAKKAYAEGADYLGSGAMFGSTTKKDAIPMTKERLKEIVNSVPIPVVAIGGIHKGNISELSNTGIKGVALVSGIFAAEDIEEECRILKEESLKIKKSFAPTSYKKVTTERNT